MSKIKIEEEVQVLVLGRLSEHKSQWTLDIASKNSPNLLFPYHERQIPAGGQWNWAQLTVTYRVFFFHAVELCP